MGCSSPFFKLLMVDEKVRARHPTRSSLLHSHSTEYGAAASRKDTTHGGPQSSAIRKQQRELFSEGSMSTIPSECRGSSAGCKSKYF